MTNERDAHLTAALELQLATIGPLAARVDQLCSGLAAAAPAEWSGPAQQAYLVAAHVVEASVALASDALRAAVGLTGSAVRAVESRA